jgi:hypothetical protein
LDEQGCLYERPDPEELQYIASSGSGTQLSKLLKLGEFKVEHKIKLSYVVARAFWQFYGSEMMNARWTSEDIWFISLDEEFALSDGIPLRAFVSFPFGPDFQEAPAEFCGEDQYLHRYPRILYLGIILLEIGLGYSLGLERNSRLSPKAHINTARAKAKVKLKELKSANWDGFRWKDYFVKAISNCLESANFRDTPMRQRQLKIEQETNEPRLDSPLEERKNALFQNVVAPLFWLATVGFENLDEVPVLPIQKRLIRRQSTFADNEEIQLFWKEKRDQPSFLSGNSKGTEGFLNDLQKIAGHIKRCRRNANISTPVRVAILDTGCRTKLEFFQRAERRDRIKRWKDFVTDSDSPTDEFGHGTFMARLLMHVAPIVDVYLIRVAKDADELKHSEHSIARVRICEFIHERIRLTEIGN